MNILKKNKAYFAIVFLVLLLGAFLVSAQGRELEIQYPELGGIQPKTTSISPQEYVKYIFNFALWIIGITAFGSLIFGGVRFLTSVGNPSKRTDAKNQIAVAFLGIAILLGSYFILYSINPQLTIFESKEIEKVEITPPDHFELPEVTTSINVELPIETMLREDTNGLLGTNRRTRIEDLTVEITESANYSKDLSYELERATKGCTCSSPCGTGCLTPICKGECIMIAGVCVSLGCSPGRCTSDPCCKVREKLTEIKIENIRNISKIQEQNKKTKEEIVSIETMTEKIQKTLEIMKNDCPLSGVISRDQFISSKDYYIEQGWKLKKIQYWDEFETLIPSSQADFYCPVGGNQSSYIPESELSEEDIGEYNEIFLDYLNRGGEFETTIDCPRPIPFGEVIDKGLKIANDLTEEMKELDKLQNEIIEAIDKLHKAVSECTSKNCKPVCGCTCCSECGCEGCDCVGEPCPIISAKKVDDISKKISQKQKEIDKIINEDIPDFLDGPFKEMAEKIHFCIADPDEIEPGWALLNCERAIGAIGPDKKIFEKTSECKISDNCSILKDCYEYNFFCCRAKD